MRWIVRNGNKALLIILGLTFGAMILSPVFPPLLLLVPIGPILMLVSVIVGPRRYPVEAAAAKAHREALRAQRGGRGGQPTAHRALVDTSVEVPSADTRRWIPEPVAPPRLWPDVLQPWGARNVEFEVDNEADHRSEIGSLYTDRGIWLVEDDDRGTTLQRIDGVLALTGVDTASKIAVVLDGKAVGHLSHETAALYREFVDEADAARTHIPLMARVWAVRRFDEVRARITIWLPSPALVNPPVPLEPHHVLLPSGSRLQVTGEENHMSVLAQILAGRSEAPAVAALHEEPPTGRAAKSRIAVRINDQNVGLLSHAMTDQFLPIVRGLAEQGQVAVSRATVVGNALKADVVLTVARGTELPHAWIEAHIPDVTRIESES